MAWILEDDPLTDEPLQVPDVGLGEVRRLRHAEDGCLPKRLGLVVTIESFTKIFCLANIDDRLGTVFILAE